METKSAATIRREITFGDTKGTTIDVSISFYAISQKSRSRIEDVVNTFLNSATEILKEETLD